MESVIVNNLVLSHNDPDLKNPPAIVKKIKSQLQFLFNINQEFNFGLSKVIYSKFII